MTKAIYVVFDPDNRPVTFHESKSMAAYDAKLHDAPGWPCTVRKYVPADEAPADRPDRWHWASKKGTSSRCDSGGLRVEHCSTDTYVTRVNCPTCMRRTTYKRAMEKARTK